MQLSLELEYWTVDDTGALAPAAPVVKRIDDLDAESADPMLEVVTDPCDDVAELRGEVTRRLREAIRVAREEGRRLVPLATPLNTGPIGTDDGPRTQVQRRVLGDDFANATRCAGTHLHVDRIDGAETDQVNLLTALDPAFALVSSSAHHRGENVAACARAHVYRRGCYGDHPELGRLRPYVGSVAEHEERTAASFEGFRATALSEGVDPDAFDANFAPEDSTWTPIRVREEFDTIEWRGPDVALPGQLLRLVADLENALEATVDGGLEIGGELGISADGVTVPEFDRLDEYVEAAIDDGLESPAVEGYLDAMGFDPASYRPLSMDLQGVSRLTTNQARRIRLRYADRLEGEVGLLTTPAPSRPAVTRSG
ncbi:glutamate-cysteine ligase family protein [Saliphagus sp. LR7]|uniref:glutamate-cysteine ligase family protein n=1 Tax=Saliphagus sp. LR7 TaxID=2282654 RepID=UPI000DF7E30B|nr:glutamate-cysteine ligase family protein [Saliphagus sp. LR7]